MALVAQRVNIVNYVKWPLECGIHEIRDEEEKIQTKSLADTFICLIIKNTFKVLVLDFKYTLDK